MSALGNKIQELRGELERARRRGDSARIMELSRKLDEELKKEQIEQFGTITPANMPQFTDVSAIPREKENHKKAVRELFWGSGHPDEEIPEKNKSFARRS